MHFGVSVNGSSMEILVLNKGKQMLRRHIETPRGSYEDLLFLKTVTGTEASRRTAYGLPTAFQAPLSAVFGVHRAF